MPWDARPDDDDRPAPGVADDGPVRCVACGAMLTDTRFRAEPDGAHEHAYLNPAGIVYRFACFSRAPGCREQGPASTQWSWFRDHAWRVSLCAACSAHVGWRFEAPGGDAFHGLVVERITGGR